MSWQCPYCETINQDAVPICTVCEHVAPVVESFLSLEQIDHAREYEELLSRVYSLEAADDYEKMLETALKAVSTYTQNDVAISKVHLATKLIYEKKIKHYILSKIEEYDEKKEYYLAQSFIKLWQNLKFDTTTISSYADTVNLGLSEASHRCDVQRQITETILNGNFSESLKIIDTELLTYESSSELLYMRTKIQNIISSVIIKDKPRKIPKPLKKALDTEDSTEEVTEAVSVKKSTKKKFPKVKRNDK